MLKKSLSHTAPYWKTEIAPLLAFVWLAGGKESTSGKTNPKGLEIQTSSVIHKEPPMHIFVLPFSGVSLGEPPAAASLWAAICNPCVLLQGRAWKTEAFTDMSSGKHHC